MWNTLCCTTGHRNSTEHTDNKRYDESSDTTVSTWNWDFFTVRPPTVEKLQFGSSKKLKTRWHRGNGATAVTAYSSPWVIVATKFPFTEQFYRHTGIGGCQQTLSGMILSKESGVIRRCLGEFLKELAFVDGRWIQIEQGLKPCGTYR